MQCSVKGAYPLRDDVFKQGESDARTKAFAGIIHPPPLKNERIQCYCVRWAAEEVCAWTTGFLLFILEEVKGSGAGTQHTLTLFGAKSRDSASRTCSRGREYSFFPPVARVFLKPIQMYPGCVAVATY